MGKLTFYILILLFFLFHIKGRQPIVRHQKRMDVGRLFAAIPAKPKRQFRCAAMAVPVSENQE